MIREKENKEKKPKLIVFDFSGTLAYFKKSNTERFYSDLTRLGLEVKTEEQKKLFGNSFSQNLGYSQNWLDFSQKLMKDFSIKAEKRTIKNIAGFLQKTIKLQAYPDTKEIIDLPFKKAVLSANARFLIKKILPKEFKIFGPAETKFKKPDPRAFLFVFKKLKIKPEETMMVGDEADRDLVVARELGMKTILIDRKNENKNYSGIKIKSLKELKNILGI
jgi:putative hydrolase of the HAD superfamily